jgi:hypothetical protein
MSAPEQAISHRQCLKVGRSETVAGVPFDITVPTGAVWKPRRVGYASGGRIGNEQPFNVSGDPVVKRNVPLYTVP